MTEKKRLHILMVIDLFDKELNGGVISTRRFVEQLRLNHHVEVVTTGEPGEGKVIVKALHLPGLQRAIERQDMQLGLPQTPILEEAIAKADIVHVQLPLLLGIGAIKIAKRLGKPVVSTFHVQPEQFLLNLGLPSSLLPDQLQRFFISQIYSKSDAVICPSRFAQAELERLGLKVPTTVISNGVGRCFVTGVEEIQPKERKPFHILTVGRLSREKRHHLLLEAILRSKHKEEIEVTIVGRGPMESALRKQGKELPIKPHILSNGLPPQELASLYRQANLYVHTAGFEVEAMTVLEAMACGTTPLIANAPKSAARQFAQDERSLFLAEDPTDLAQKIDYWIEHPEELHQAAVAHHAASAGYSLEASTSQLESVYQSLM